MNTFKKYISLNRLFVCLLFCSGLSQQLHATPTISFQNSTMSVSQTAGSLLVPVVISGSRDAYNPSAYFSTQNVTAYHYTDFGNPSSVDFGASNSLQNVVIPIYYTGATQDRTFILNFSNVYNCQIGSPTSCIITILGAAATEPVTFKFGAASYTVGQAAGAIQIPVYYTGSPSSSYIWVGYHTQSGTAQSSDDYGYANSSIDFQSGSNSALITIPIYNTGSTASKFFNVVLDSESEGQLGSPAATLITILGKGQSPSASGAHVKIRTRSVHHGTFTIHGTVVGVSRSQVRRVRMTIGGVHIPVQGKHKWTARVHARAGSYLMVVHAYLKGGGTLTTRAHLHVHR